MNRKKVTIQSEYPLFPLEQPDNSWAVVYMNQTKVKFFQSKKKALDFIKMWKNKLKNGNVYIRSSH
jgi:hypothetical protein